MGIDVFNLMIDANIVKPMFVMTNEKGEEIIYPNTSDTEKTYEYFIERLDLTNNPQLRSRYAHILWLSPKKHGKFAQIAIDDYLELVKIYEKKDIDDPSGLFGLDIINSIENAFALATNIGDLTRVNTLKNEIKRLIVNFNPVSKSLFVLRAQLIDLMFKYGKFFVSEDFQGLNNLCLNYAQQLQDCHQSITILEIGAKMDQKLGSSIANWKQLIAECFEKMMIANIEKNELAALHFCELALKYYREIKNTLKINELEKVYDQLKNEAEFKEISVPIDLTDNIKQCEETAKKLSGFSSEDIIKYLISEPTLLPKYKDVEKSAIEISKGHFASVIPHTVSDERGHVEQHFSTDDELREFQTLQHYDRTLQVQSMWLVNRLIIKL